MPIKWKNLPNNIPLEAPTLGQHNLKVLTESLGRTPDEVAALLREGVLVERNS
jgi:crotonobetainyl-CoA:carnitine CoA-transferase CaiB-like acyl-CoA transferase